MGEVITRLLTDTRARSDQAVEDNLLQHAEAGLAWGDEREGF